MTTPVRWWRDDADRYRSRGTPVPSPPVHTKDWFALISAIDPEMTAVLGGMLDESSPMIATGVDVVNRWFHDADPVEDIRHLDTHRKPTT